MDRIILMADILGFGSIIQNLKNEELESRINDWISIIEDLCKKYSINDFQLLSDTLFVSLEKNELNASTIVDFSKDLLNYTIDKSFPIRGAISCGELVWGKLIYGKSLIDAYKIESLQNWIGITCSSSFTYTQNLYKDKKLICYPPCFKNGEFKLMAVVNWDPPPGKILLGKLISKGLLNNGEKINRNIQTILDNTNIFRLYKISMGKRPLTQLDKYYGHFYTNFLEF